MFASVNWPVIAMTAKPRRPPSVWISQILLVLFFLLSGWSVFNVVSVFRYYSLGHMVWTRFEFWSNVFVGVASLVAFFGLTFRLSFSRWFSVAVFTAIVTMSALELWLVQRPGDLSWPAAQLAVVCLLLVPLSFLSFRLIFSNPAGAFFKGRPTSLEDRAVSAPPPPPTFNI